MNYGRMTKNQEKSVYRFVANLIINRKSEVVNDSGNFSPKKISDLLKNELGFNYSVTSVAKLLKKDLSKLNKDKPVTNEDIKDINKNLNILDGIINNPDSKPYDKIRASNAYSNLMKTKGMWEKMLSDVDIRKAETLKPVYDIKFGHYHSVLVTCPKCKHKFYDIPVKKKATVENDLKESIDEFRFKSGDGQSTLEESTSKKEIVNVKKDIE